jgi:hypothetical protein
MIIGVAHIGTKWRWTWECEGNVDWHIGRRAFDNDGDEIASLASELLRPALDQELGDLDTTP